MDTQVDLRLHWWHMVRTGIPATQPICCMNIIECHFNLILKGKCTFRRGHLINNVLLPYQYGSAWKEIICTQFLRGIAEEAANRKLQKLSPLGNVSYKSINHKYLYTKFAVFLFWRLCKHQVLPYLINEMGWKAKLLLDAKLCVESEQLYVWKKFFICNFLGRLRLYDPIWTVSRKHVLRRRKLRPNFILSLCIIFSGIGKIFYCENQVSWCWVQTIISVWQ